MAALKYTDIQQGVFFKMNGVVYETLSAVFSKKSRQKGSNQVRIKNIATGSVTTKTLHASDSFEPVSIEKEDYVFIYTQGDTVYLHPNGMPAQRIQMPATTLPNSTIIPANTPVTALTESGSVLAFIPPIKVEVQVQEAPPGVRGNTAQGGTKRVTLETGVSIAVPLFIQTGDRIRIHTETGEYVERVK